MEMLINPAVNTTDFSHETWWISVIKAVAILLILILGVLLQLWVERRGLGRIQTRPGPNVRGPFGLLQAIADAGKMVFKESFWPRGADLFIYILAPLLVAFTAFAIFSIIPLGPNVQIGPISTPLQMFDSPVATLIVLAISSVGVYGIVLGGWSSNSPYPLLGSVRSTAQVISYELAMGTAMVSVFIMAGSMSTSKIVEAQQDPTWLLGLLPAFIIYVIASFGEVNRLPFDLTECEGELVAGHQTEYSGMNFAWFYLAEYINIMNVSAMSVTMFLGGWKAPWAWDFMNPVTGSPWWGPLWFGVKVWGMFWFFVWVRGTLVRFRYDQFMNLGWKVLIPVGFVWMMAVAWIKALPVFFNFNSQQVMLAVAVVCGVLLVVVLVIPARRSVPIHEAPFDAFADGYPVPPLPGQVLGSSPRAGRIKMAPHEPATAIEEGGAQQ
ncbi:NADH dehydrogenase [Mobiluncus mulieris 28-1]|uniref:NADH-quinone oxidoreductase subunit NuoH n=1 Tax=Mobiluncus mulieris TaxID=2052 RepID=UPI0001BE7AB7|nr:NADH-quinone oxidoreductase subunit NuoH [Mobiluncus mulieris]EEZ90779.1 NADH dehydrogenase [Mobiluncus mulieris 28-1]PNL42473.1 NADH-quinone oxidoreductase subunit NuoH [Mobiluncus mulieris]